MKLIVGLGNPGAEYVGTRHNVGFEVVDGLVNQYNLGRANNKFGSEIWGPLTVKQGPKEDKLLLVKPQTYMNLSGIAVAETSRYYKITPQDILVIYDDIALPLGILRLRSKGSAGGHNGMKSTIAYLGTTDFPRLRIGIGAASNQKSLVGHVIGHFSKDERPVIDKAIGRAIDAASQWCFSDFSKLMTSVNNHKTQEE